MGFATVAALDSGNLVHVAKALHEKYPEKQIVIAGDDDKHLELTHGINPGRSKAEEAARAVGGTVLLPIFAPNENSYPGDLEAVTPQKFRKGQLSDKQHEALAKMKQYTDFNDLATISTLGREASLGSRNVYSLPRPARNHRRPLSKGFHRQPQPLPKQRLTPTHFGEPTLAIAIYDRLLTIVTKFN